MYQQAVEHRGQDSPPCMVVPKLLDICWQAAASGHYWRYQRRYLDMLPEEAANLLLHELLRQHRLSKAPGYLSLFKRCVTSLVLGGREQHVRLDATWLAYVAELGHLRQLELHGDSNKPLSDQALAPLAALHGTLQELSLLGDAQYSVGFKLTGAGWAVVNQLTGLQSLDLSGLSVLTHLNCEGLMITDDDCMTALPQLQALASLNLAGCVAVTNASFAAFEQLPNLQHLDIGWGGCDGLPCFARLRVLCMHNSRLASSEWCTTWLAERGGSVPLSLEAIQLSGCEVDSAEVLEALASLIRCSGRLRTLDVSSVTLQGSANEDLLTLLLSFGATQHLTKLDVSRLSPQLHNDHLAAIAAAGCTALADLDISYAHISGEGLEQLAQLPALSSLQVAGCALRDADLPALWQLTSLTRLALQSNHITGELPARAAVGTAAQPAVMAPAGSTGMSAGVGAVQEHLHWGCLSRLRHLQLEPGQFSERGLAALAAGVSGLLTLLISLDNMGERPGAVASAKALAHIGGLTCLRELAMDVTPAVLPKLTVLGKLEQLSLLRINWQGPPLAAIAAAGVREFQAQLPCLHTMTLQGKPADQALQAAQSTAQAAGASPGESGPWQESSLRRRSGAGSSNRVRSTSRGGDSTPVNSQQVLGVHKEQRRSSIGGMGSMRSPSPTAASANAAGVPPSPSRFDQRMKYTPQELLCLRGHACADGNAARVRPSPSNELRTALPDDLRAEE